MSFHNPIGSYRPSSFELFPEGFWVFVQVGRSGLQ